MLNEDLYLEFVMKEAHRSNKFFLLDSGEGNDYVDSETGWDVEDLSGWLVNKSEKEKLIKSREDGTAYDDFSASYLFVKWSKDDDNKLRIHFIKY